MSSIGKLQKMIKNAVDIKQLTQEVAEFLRMNFEVGKQIHIEERNVNGNFPAIDFLPEHDTEILDKLRFRSRISGHQYEYGFAYYLNNNAREFYQKLKEEHYYENPVVPDDIVDDAKTRLNFGKMNFEDDSFEHLTMSKGAE